MTYEELERKFVNEYGAEKSTMMSAPCLRYKGQFIAMMFDMEEALIIKVSEKRVDELIAENVGREFNFTKKRFKQWVMLPKEQKGAYEKYLFEALEYAKSDMSL